MAADTEWPSEDEDFDAKTDSAHVKALNSQPEKLVAKPVKKSFNKVSVAVSEPNAHQSQEVDEVERAFDEPVQSRNGAEVVQGEEPEQAQEPEQADEPEQQEDYQAPQDTPEEPAAYDAPDHYEPAPKAPRAPRDKSGMARTILEVVLVLALIGVGYYAYGLHNDKTDLTAKVATLNANPQIAIQKQTEELIAKVGALMNLPSGEAPTVANVSDAAKAKQQSSFFANAQNGDKVLMYVKAGEAILYRPSTNKIVLVAPLTFNADSTKAATPAKTTTPATTPTTKR